jgi:flagellar biosynthesis chaperone FliJ
MRNESRGEIQGMARTLKYLEEKLLEAVVKFSEVEKSKIKATELAAWSRSNIEGLEEVRDYHFTRPVKEKDNKTGKISYRPRLCTIRIEEINKSRNLVANISENLLLRASDIGTFMEQPAAYQRKMIVKTRETVDRLLARNQYLTRENEALKTENGSIRAELATMKEKAEILVKTQEKLRKQINYLMKATDEAARKEMLARMGVMDDGVDLKTYVDSLSLDISDVLNISKTLKTHISEGMTGTTDEGKETLADMVLSGLDLQEDTDEKSDR